MIGRIAGVVARAQFQRSAKAIFRTPPLTMRASHLRILTQLRHSDVTAYLLAIKSVYPKIGHGSAIVLDDGSLTGEDRATIARHVPAVEFRGLAAGTIPGVPRGGTWERLGALLREAPEHYVIQMDSDLLCLGEMTKVASAIKANRPFALSNLRRPGHVTLAEMSEWIAAKGWSHDQVQVIAEHRFASLPFSRDCRYIRASSAFVGIPRGCDAAEQLRRFSDAMWCLLGARWTEWGSEQVGSNFVIANAGFPEELTPPRYVNFMPGLDHSQAVLIHFLGSHRYEDGVYARHARTVVTACGV